MSRLALLAVIPAVIGAPVAAQTVDHSAHTAPAAAAARPAAQPAQPAASPHAGHVMKPPAAPPAARPPATPQASGPHAGHAMPAPQPAPPAEDLHAGHIMSPTPQPPAAPAGDPHAGHVMPPAPEPPAASAADPHAGHVMPPAPAGATDPHAGHDMTGASGAPAVIEPQAPPPPPPADRLADGFFGTEAMNRARAELSREHGGALYSKVMANILEHMPDGDGYRWDVEAWYGGDINRLVLKTEGDGADGDLEEAELQVLYSRAVGVYTDAQAGVRYDFEASRTYATIGVETLFPYWFEAEGALFLGTEGDLLARLAGSYDWRLTQRLILQPQAELTFAAQDDEETGVGSGFSSSELGLRLRYEIRREFAPYVGVSYERSFGGTADFARADGEDTEETRFVVGLRAWF